MKSGAGTCSGCYWYEKCDGDYPCEDYTPLDDTQADIEFYQTILRENKEEYRSFVEEMNA